MVHSITSDNLSQGFLILLLASFQVSILSWLSGFWGDAHPRLEKPLTSEWVVSIEAPTEIFVQDSLLEGEETWEDAIQTVVQPRRISHAPLSRFLTALDRTRAEKGRVRIAYFGDSMIEGDLITQSLRHDLQALFGGEGVGFVPVFSEYPGFRRTIKHRFEGWKHYNFFKRAPRSHSLGISGEVFLPQRPANLAQTWVRYRSTDVYPGTQKFQRAKLYYGQSEQSNAYVIVSVEGKKDTLPLPATAAVNELVLTREVTDEIKLNFHIPNDMAVFGLSFESENGVLVDNFPSRGNSGMNLVNISGETLEDFGKHMKYDLVVLQYGLNVISANRKNYKSYERGMKKVIRHFQTHMPEADILLVSVSDKSTRINGVLQTDPSVPLIVEAQRRIAQETQVGFLNLFEGMGGRNSMIHWVDRKLARSDYAHPTKRGAERVSLIVKNFLLEKYDSFAQHQDQSLSRPLSMNLDFFPIFQSDCKGYSDMNRLRFFTFLGWALIGWQCSPAPTHVAVKVQDLESQQGLDSAQVSLYQVLSDQERRLLSQYFTNAEGELRFSFIQEDPLRYQIEVSRKQYVAPVSEDGGSYANTAWLSPGDSNQHVLSLTAILPPQPMEPLNPDLSVQEILLKLKAGEWEWAFLPKLKWADIPVLLEAGLDTSKVGLYPRHPQSSYRPDSARVGLVALWLIEAVRRHEIRGGEVFAVMMPPSRAPVLGTRRGNPSGRNSPRQIEKAHGAYQRWWEAAQTDSARTVRRNPLRGQGLSWM